MGRVPRHGWEERLILMCGDSTNHIHGWCLEVHDLAVAKLELQARLRVTDLAPPVRTLAEARARALHL